MVQYIQERLEEVNMPGHGNSKIAIFVLLWQMSLFAYGFAQGNYYYLCSYATSNWGTPVALVKVNLDTKSIESQLEIPIRGELAFRTPVPIVRNNHIYYVVATNDGDAAKNATSLPFPLLRYSVVDDNMHSVAQGQLDGISLLGLFQYPLNPQTAIRIYKRLDDSSTTYRGRPILGSRRNFDVDNLVREQNIDEDSPVIGGFQYFNRIDPTNDRFYWNTKNQGVYLLVIDYQNRILLDSLQIINNRSYANLFEFSQRDSIIYAFFINYNSLGGPEDSQKQSIDPSFLITYRSTSLTRLDSIPLPYPALDYGYVQPEIGNCDQVGPYFIYYFFLQETYKYFSPAMLFIFDTRTNEATWLRVGWR
jgi:hypothetical protein